MTAAGIIVLIIGVVLVLYGNSINSDMESQLESLFSNGTTNPGNTFLYIGIAIAVVGLIMFIAGITKKNK